MTEVSSTRLYLGNLPRNATKADIDAHFSKHGTGKIVEIKLMNGFGFIEYEDALDARDVVPAQKLTQSLCRQLSVRDHCPNELADPLRHPRDASTDYLHKDGSTFMGERLTVQFARGSRNREPGGPGNNERTAPRPRRTPHRMQISGLPTDTSWQDLKDFARGSGLDVVYSETGRNGNGEGFVEFETAADLTTAVEKLDGREFKDKVVTCVANTQPDIPRDSRGRSRSPPGRRPYPPRDEYDRRGPPPRGYSPRRDGYRDGYRERSPRREYYDDRGPRYGSPPRRGPMDDYPPPRGRYEDPYRRDYPPPDPYAAPRPYDRPPPRDFPPRDAAYPREGGYPPRAEYDRGGRYW